MSSISDNLYGGAYDCYIDPNEEIVNREGAVEFVKKNGLFLEDIENFQEDEEVVLAAVRQNGLALQYARLQNNERVVLAAVRQNGLALQYASERLQDVKQIAIAAIRRSGPHVYPYISENLREDEDIKNQLRLTIAALFPPKRSSCNIS